ncbi:MAG: DUF3604 domain-containing protein [Myxococcales bacterium]|nr:DUF3604 domain-containing protein [Myxococcales bacterium]
MLTKYLCLAGALLAASCQSPPAALHDGGAPDLPPRTGPCADNNPLRSVFFGDLHAHTALSFDAYTYRVRALPADAYRFARGEKLTFTGDRELALDRPLDFAAVTEHAEYLGEVALCTDETSPAYSSATCTGYRNLPYGAVITWGLKLQQQPVRYDFCGADNDACLARAGEIWKRVQQAAEDATDKSAQCRFTAFKAYEWSGFPSGANLHRNVIFATSKVPAEVVSYYDEPTPAGLWKRLARDCSDVDGCDVIVIPHNSNLSRGEMWTDKGADGKALTKAEATQRVALERLVEVTQHKGDSECGALSSDELCGYEKYEPATAFPLSFVREALKLGLRLRQSTGVNPFAMGLSAASDNHNAAPGAVEEDRFPGAFGVKDDLPNKLLSTANLAFNPGGLTAVWAEENSRASLFAAMKRRETYGTSGPRITLRFFGGYGYDSALCSKSGDELARAGYDGGVPMGSELTARSEAPTFVVAALRDAGSARRAGSPLERLQIIKGFIDQSGALSEKVYDVAGEKVPESTVDLGTCQSSAKGHDNLCTVWRDPDYDATQAAFYYARAVEVPSCRWNSWLCVQQGVDCAKGAPAGLGNCCSDDKRIDRIQRERAFSSPIWVYPQGGTP